MQRSGFRSHRGTNIHTDVPQRLVVRIKNILLILLIIALAVTLILGLPAIQYRSDAKGYIAERMLVECNDAQYNLTKVSNSGGSSTYAQLARIRSEIYSIQVLNQTYAAMEGSGGNTLIDDSVFSDIFSQIDNYYSQLITSSTNTSIVLTDLDLLLTSLNEKLNAIQ